MVKMCIWSLKTCLPQQNFQEEYSPLSYTGPSPRDMCSLCGDSFFEKRCFYVFEVEYFSSFFPQAEEWSGRVTLHMTMLLWSCLCRACWVCRVMRTSRSWSVKQRRSWNLTPAGQRLGQSRVCFNLSVCLKAKLELSLLVQWPQGLALLPSPRGPMHDTAHRFKLSCSIHTYANTHKGTQSSCPWATLQKKKI